MTAEKQYQEWLTDLDNKSKAFRNSYWFAVLSKKLESQQDPSCDFTIPLSTVEKELQREANNNADINKVYVSTVLRQWISQMLQAKGYDARATNDNTSLRDYLTTGILPDGVECPIGQLMDFHFLPTECKLWILCALLGSTSEELKSCAKDKFKNIFYILPGCKLYVELANVGSVEKSTDEGCAKWASLNQYVRRRQFKLLSETEDEWRVVGAEMQRCKMHNTFALLDRLVACALSTLDELRAIRAEQKKKFAQAMAALPPIEDQIEFKRCRNFPMCSDGANCRYYHPRDLCKDFRNCDRDYGCLNIHPLCFDDGDCGRLECPYEHLQSDTTLNRLANSEDWSPQSRDTAKKSLRCQFLPSCFGDCAYAHPSAKCSSLQDGACPAGQLCPYVHGICADDGKCEQKDCIYEHLKSVSFAERKWFMKTRGKAVKQKNLSEDEQSNVKSSEHEPRYNRRCWFGLHCTRETCWFAHPTKTCDRFPACPMGGICLNLHDCCPRNGECREKLCDLEHTEERPISVTWCRDGAACTSKESCMMRGRVHPTMNSSSRRGSNSSTSTEGLEGHVDDASPEVN